MDFLLALLSAAIVAVPWLFSRYRVIGLIIGVVVLVLDWIFYYLGIPNLARADGSAVGIVVIAELIVSTIIYCAINYNDSGYRSRERDAVPVPLWIGVLAVCFMLIRACASSEFAQTQRHAELIGPMDLKVWTQDVQPKDPKHIRLVPWELANWLADKQLGSAGGSIGSQFTISKNHMTLQIVNGQLWYVAPLDFRDYWVWNQVGVTPGYVKVNAEDPTAQVEVVVDKKFAFTPEAAFDKNLERHLRDHGYLTRNATDFTFELDEQGKAWWTATVSRPTIVYGGDKVDGVALVDPVDGNIVFHAVGQVPEWIDRVIPQHLVKDYITKWGDLRDGYWHCEFGAKNGCLEPGDPLLVYGADNRPYWVTDITSNNENDKSMVGIIYTDARTGKSTRYEAKGGTPEAVVSAVNSKVGFKQWHGADPMLYNMYGIMVAVVPVLAGNHSFQGVAIVRVDNLQVAVGDDAQSALREFQRLESQSGQQIAAESGHSRVKVAGEVDRIASEVREKETIWYVHLKGISRLFTGDSHVSPKLPVTKPGDSVELEYNEAGEDVESILRFDNRSLPLDKTATQKEVEAREAESRAAAANAAETRTLRERVKTLSDDQLRKLFEGKKPEGNW